MVSETKMTMPSSISIDFQSDPETDRYRGALIGLAVGDCLGASVEFCPPGSFPPVTGLRPGGPFRLEVGQWTDDTSMALCLAESLIAHDGQVVPRDMLQRWHRWYTEGYRSSTGACFDIGNATRTALDRFAVSPADACGDDDAAGNGSIMRLAPLSMAYAYAGPAVLLEAAARTSLTTHGAPEATDGARLLAMLVADALRGELDRSLLLPRACGRDTTTFQGFHPKIRGIFEGNIAERAPPEIVASGYVVDTLTAALWAFARSTSFGDGALPAVNLGNDADTVGAVYGQLAGAYYGSEAIPSEWQSPLAQRQLIVDLANQLHALAPRVVARSAAHPWWKRLLA